eukprot:Clim_evm90s134 gene=Clim_evmTU90s134
MTDAQVVDQIDAELREHYERFFQKVEQGTDAYLEKYLGRRQAMIDRGECRMTITLDDLQKYKPERYEDLLRSPVKHLEALTASFTAWVEDADKTYTVNHPRLHLAMDGNFGGNALSLRTMRSEYLGQLIEVDGIVTRCSLVRPKLLESVHSAQSGLLKYVKYKDGTSLSGVPTNTMYPTKDENGDPYETEYGLCKYQDSQTITIQEMPEHAPAGQIPRGIDVVLEEDLCDTVKPGDRIRVSGVYRALPSKSQGATSGVFRTILLATSARPIKRTIGQTATMSEADISSFKNLAKRHKNNMFDLLSKSLAPSIWGADYIKRGLLALLLGGEERVLDNGTHLRGDINMLMVGDPSTAKSQFLRFVMNLAPLAIATTGRGSSGVGLTAAVMRDPETGERSLEAGAMVLGDRGVVCIDEFDKMSDDDRVAIHEVMEQQTVTINKAGIHTSLNARCSVIAAANPIYGMYDRTSTPMKNIGLPDSLLSRFDLLFIVLDSADAQRDSALAGHVLRIHRTTPTANDGGARAINGLMDDDIEEQDDNDNRKTPIWDEDVAYTGGRSRRDRVLSLPFVQKYIAYAKRRHPIITDEAREEIVRIYVTLRSSSDQDKNRGTLPITARTLESMIRISTAIAKARLSTRVEMQDVAMAKDILEFSLKNAVQQSNEAKKAALEAQAQLRREREELLEAANQQQEQQPEETDAAEDAAMEEAAAVTEQQAQAEAEEIIAPSRPRGRRRRVAIEDDDEETPGQESVPKESSGGVSYELVSQTQESQPEVPQRMVINNKGMLIPFYEKDVPESKHDTLKTILGELLIRKYGDDHDDLELREVDYADLMHESCDRGLEITETHAIINSMHDEGTVTIVEESNLIRLTH